MVAPVKTTFRQELFLREMMKTPIAAEAWQRVYKTKRVTARIMASRTLKKPHVARRLNELREPMMKKADISVEKVLNDYQHALDLAKSQQKAGEIIAAASAQAKLVGLLRDRVETGGVGDFGDTNSIADVLELVAKEAGPEAAMTLAAMFGLKVPETQATKNMQEAVLFIADPASDAVN
jgi:hypothetical protein